MRYETKGHHKSSELLSYFLSHFGSFMNLARVKCLSQLVCAMCKVKTVNFAKLAPAIRRDGRLRRAFMTSISLCKVVLLERMPTDWLCEFCVGY